ncbi:hypothetical protein RhiirA5_384471 [Rhizophagus irregularis]|uniref:Uncharacterized protein n=1 Tax=Rhizophagus irregularis TaxID=588596 RepID=A0A2N0NT08_9GLOM|nr:hypothetical protein RhiirA5_384471 [Rhizophagus irregularis]
MWVGSVGVGWECGVWECVWVWSVEVGVWVGSVGVGVWEWVWECGVCVSVGVRVGSVEVGVWVGSVGLWVWECGSVCGCGSARVWVCVCMGPFRFSLYLGLFLLGPLLYIQILYSLVPYITDLEK